MGGTGGRKPPHAVEVHHIIPTQFFRDFRKIFEDYLPGFHPDSPYNYAIAGYTQAAAQVVSNCCRGC